MDSISEQLQTQTVQQEYAPRIKYVCEPPSSNFSNAKRVICIVFTYNKSGEVKYGASIFNRAGENKVFKKETFRMMAQGRLKVRPVTFNMATEQDKLPEYKNVVSSIRKTMCAQGVHGKERSDVQEKQCSSAEIVCRALGHTSTPVEIVCRV